MDLTDYLTNPSPFVWRLCFTDNGKVREVTTYNGEGGRLLRKKQEELLTSFDPLPTSSLSYAYKKGKKVLDAVKPHLGHLAFVKLDIKGYFDHIDVAILREKMEAFGLTSELGYCFYQDHLPIGFVTSPKLSDFYLYDLDKACEEYLAKHPGLAYSRYADDFLLSSEKEDFEELGGLVALIKEELEKVKCFLNEEKTLKAVLGKQTSVRFLGLNIGKEKITLSKWYLLKTLNAFKRYKIARYNKANNINELKSVAYGLYAFIRENSPTSLVRFHKKYKNAFGEPFPAWLPREAETDLVTYKLCRGGDTYRAIINTTKPNFAPKEIDPDVFFSLTDLTETKKEDEAPTGPESIYIPDTFHDLKVIGVSADGRDNGLKGLKRIRLPKGLRSLSLRNRVPSVTEAMLGDVVDLSSLKAKGEVSPLYNEVGLLVPHYDEWDYDERVISVKKLDGRYVVSESTNGCWSVTGMSSYEKEESLVLSGNPELDRLYDYLVEKVVNNRIKCRYGRYAYVRIGEKEIRSPVIDIETLAVLERFYGKRVDFNTKSVYGKNVDSIRNEEENVKPIPAPRVGDEMRFFFPLPEEKEVRLCVDFEKTTDGHLITHEEFVPLDNRMKRKLSRFHVRLEERAKELLLEGLKDFGEEKGLIKVTFRDKGYYADTISSRLYHLLQFLSPIPFVLPEGMLCEEGYGEYYYAAPEAKKIEPNAFVDLKGVRVLRLRDDLASIGENAFKGNLELERVYLAASFYAYRHPHLHIEAGVFDDCPHFDGYIRRLLGTDEQRFNPQTHSVEDIPYIEIEVKNDEDLERIKALPPHSVVRVLAYQPIFEATKKALEENENIVAYQLRMTGYKPKAHVSLDDDDNLPF